MMESLYPLLLLFCLLAQLFGLYFAAALADNDSGYNIIAVIVILVACRSYQQ